jgi:hypothetical protein
VVGGRFGNCRADAVAPRLRGFDKTGANASSSARGGGRELLDMRTRFFEARRGLPLRWRPGRERPSEERAGDLALSFGDKPEWRDGLGFDLGIKFLGETAGARPPGGSAGRGRPGTALAPRGSG